MELKFKKIKGFNLRAFKKALSIFLAVIILLSCLPASVLAETLSLSANIANSTSGDISDEFVITSGYYTCYVSNGEAAITGVDESISGDIEIPSTIEGYTVTGIGDDAFYLRDSLTSITIPNSVTSIGDWAFEYCSSLTSVTIPDSVTSIGYGAFYGCSSLTSITIPNSVTSIDDETFYNCSSITSITIPNSVTSIGSYAFSSCSSLTTITIPNSVTSIGYATFSGCSKLTSITIPNGVSSIDYAAFAGCDSLTSVTIGNSVTSIGNYAFYDCSSLTSVTIPNSVTSIDKQAFYGCESLTNITIPDSVAEIGNLAFRYCKSITSITIPNSVTSIAYGTFYDCDSLASITIPDSVKSIGDCSFRGCKSLTDITIPKNTTSLGWGAFYSCDNLKNVKVYSKNCEFNSECGLNEKHTIFGYKGSTAEAFAKEIGAKFIDIESIHTHKYSNATCTKAKTCTICGTTSGTALGHKYSNACDKTCNVCNSARTVGSHQYTNKCDTTCNICNAKRTVTHAYKNVVTKATLTKNGKVVKKCSVCGKVASTTTVYYPKTIKLAKTTYTYTGKVIKPAITVKGANGKAIAKTNYTVTYAKGRKNVGTYKVTVTFKGNYSGTKAFNFTINPVKTTVNKLVAGNKNLKVTIGKKTNQVTGYEIQYATNKTFKSAKKVNVKSYKTTTVNLTKLAAKKTYYVRVRTYKTVGKTKYYSAWSTAKNKKTK